MSRLPAPAGLRLTSLARLVPPAPLPPLPPAGPYLVDDALVHALDLARRAGHPAAVVAWLAAALEVLDDRARSAVVDPLERVAVRAGGATGPGVRPLRIGGAVARQTDGTTCGSAVLALLAAAGDPVLALWLTTGRRPGDGALERRGPPGPGPGDASGASARFRSLQQTVKRWTNRGALGPLPWPSALGTPPWGAARVARYADVRFAHRMVDADTSPGARVLGAALDAAARGVPVPLFTGGDLGLGVATAVPRHVVLLTSADPAPETGAAAGADPAPGARRCWVYEPSSGTVHRLDANDLLDGSAHGAVRRALGGWPHVCWALLPARRAGEVHRPAGGWTDPRTRGEHAGGSVEGR